MSDDNAGNPTAAARFHRVAEASLDVLMAADPGWATSLGDHRYDDRLPDFTPEGRGAVSAGLSQAIAALDDVDDSELTVSDQVDLEILRNRLTARSWAHDDLAEQTWNPLGTLPTTAFYELATREVGDPAARVLALTARLSAVPDYLAAVRDQLTAMPQVHVEIAVTQTRGLSTLVSDASLLTERVKGFTEQQRESFVSAQEAAVAALTTHAGWLTEQVESADRDPRLGGPRFAAKLWYALDTETGPDALLDRAESDLMAIEERIAEVAAQLAPQLGVTAHRAERVRAVLDALAAAAPVTDDDIVRQCTEQVEWLADFIRTHEVVTVPSDPVEVIVMPPARRGVAVAYCDPPGPLEPDGPAGPAPTFFAVSPTPPGWSAEQVASFYREYNGYMLANLTAHEAIPGHVLQLAHARRLTATTSARVALRSGTFVEGWAVYAEEVVADLMEEVHPGQLKALAWRMQQLKMQLRATINAILDVRVHTRGMSESEAMQLMTVRGHQEWGEAAGKWRRVLLTSTQLSTYYVGYQEVREVVRGLRAAQPGWSTQEIHDSVLAYGAPPPRLLRVLLDLDDSAGIV
ncbi:MAG: DUF885 domain-containing protein [Actinomycetota bacterium]